MQVLADRFELEKVVGTGGMGEVYRARDRLTGKPVAVKLLFASLHGDVDRFQREALLLAELHHPRIVRYVAHGLTPTGRAYLAMEWLEGEDLGDRLTRRPLSIAETIAVGRRLAEALAALHERGIVHRDVKPSNAFLVGGAAHDVKLLDLGVARLTSGARQATHSGVMIGTPGYMAPEQARGQRDVDTRADVFALGCVLFECLAGRPAFVGDNMPALLAKILLEPSPRVSSLAPAVPPELDDLVARMLEKHALDRPANGAAVLRALEQLHAEELPIDSRTSGQHPRAITGGERQLVAVVMARPPELEGDELSTSAPTSEETAIASFDLRTVATSFGADLAFLADGSIVFVLARARGATEQATDAARFALALRSHLPGATIALATGLATYPDVTIVCGPRELDPEDANTVVNPTVLVEVLSPSTEDYDRGEKRLHYQALASLEEYVLVAQDRRAVHVFRRRGEEFVEASYGAGESVELASVGATIAVDELYESAGLSALR